MPTEKLTLASAANSLWQQPSAAGLDNATDFPSEPATGSPVVFSSGDGSEAQIWDLSSLAGSYEDGTIDVTVYAFGESATSDEVLAAIKVGGSFGSDQSLQWSGSADWRSAQLATGLSAADFSGAQLRLTSPSSPTGQSFAAIYVLIEGDEEETGTATASATGGEPDPLEITTLSLPDGTVGEVYVETITATGGTTPYAWANVSGTVPPGLSVDSTGTPSTSLNGTPTTAGVYMFEVQVTDDDSDTDTQQYEVEIFEATGTATAAVKKHRQRLICISGITGVNMGMHRGQSMQTF